MSDLVESAMFLLEHLPAARQAVLQYLSNVFHDAVNNEFASRDSSGRATNLLQGFCYANYQHCFVIKIFIEK